MSRKMFLYYKLSKQESEFLGTVLEFTGEWLTRKWKKVVWVQKTCYKCITERYKWKKNLLNKSIAS